MSGTKRIQYLITGNGVDLEDQSALSYWVNRLVTPILRALVSLTNRLAADAVSTSVNLTLNGSEGLVLVDASGGPRTITLPVPTALFHPLIVQKVDSSGNAVTVATPGVVTINGAVSLPIAAQYDRLLIVADDSAFYA